MNQNGPNKPGEKKPENEEAPKNQKPNENKTKGSRVNLEDIPKFCFLCS